MKDIWSIGIGIVLIIGIAYLIYFLDSLPGEYDSFAECLTANGVVMYGTDWCHVCQDQKALFGKSFKYINYKNCDYLKQECNNIGVEAYPTWRFADTNHRGLQSLEELASLTGCNL